MNKISQFSSEYIAKVDSAAADWAARYQNLPRKETVPLHNANRADTLTAEIAKLNETLHWLENVMVDLDSEHERYMCREDGTCYRYRERCSVENTEMMLGPRNPCMEDWLAVLRDDLLDCRKELNVNLSITQKGDVGERNVFRELYARYPTLSNIVLDVADQDGATNETDFYAILPHGVAVIEVKNYGKSGQQLRIEDNSHTAPWKLTTSQGHHLDDKKNPFYQNDRHIHATRKVLQGLLDKEIPLFSVVVLGNDQVQIINRSDLIVTNPRNLCSRLNALVSDITLTEQEQGIIMRHLQSLDIGARSFFCPSYRKRIEHIYQLAREIAPVLGDNKAIRTRYYSKQADRKKKNDRLAAALIGIVALFLIPSRNIGDFIGYVFLLCLVISAVAVLSQTINQLFPKIGTPTKKTLLREICQDINKQTAAAGPDSPEVKLLEFDYYLTNQAERYPLRFEVNVPLESLPEQYISLEALQEKIAQAYAQSADYVNAHFQIEDFDLFCLGLLYDQVSRELTLGFQMIRHICHTGVETFVSLKEAEQYYQEFFRKANGFISRLHTNVLMHEDGPREPIEALPLLDELGVYSPIWCRTGDNAIMKHYGGELEQLPSFLSMLAECHRYASYLLDLGCMYYEICGVVVDDDGNLFEITDWNQTRENFQQFFNSDQQNTEITSADFLNAVV